MPPPTSDPAGTSVLTLCGQPLQKYGVRFSVSGMSTRVRAAERKGASRSSVSRSTRRDRNGPTIESASSEPCAARR
ncbi:unannotated protein [freshwater metagenome]|uniref:Unannotated protein n=1 Tax=freshwater metagenome TaxID=449393 RepID=A0A6J6YZA2_9ZZZZ